MTDKVKLAIMVLFMAFPIVSAARSFVQEWRDLVRKEKDKKK